jgi:cobalt/nickel transport system permease protein
MPAPFDLSLLAVHISDGLLEAPWWIGGFVGAALLAWLAAWRIREEEIPRVALLTAGFFVASLIHVRVGPTSVHLLFNGLVGVVLGRRAALAIVIGVALQVALLGHGGFTTIGINSCVMALPALLSWQLFRVLHRLPWLRRPWFRAVLVGFSGFVWTLSLLYSVVLLGTNRLTEQDALDLTGANAVAFHPLAIACAAIVAGAAAWLEHRLENAPEFPLGLLVGETAVLTTALLNCLVLLWGGQEDWHALALLVFVAHLPIAVIEGIVLGFTVGFLARVKPELLDWQSAQADRNKRVPFGDASRNGEPPGPTRKLTAEVPLRSTEAAE